MRNALITLIAIFTLSGLFILVRGAGPRTIYSEAQCAQLAPTKVGEFAMVQQDPKDPSVSYKMDQVTYETLEPFGIVCRVMSNAGSMSHQPIQSYDTVLILSDDEKSFHSPEFCFQSQGCEIVDRKIINVPTLTRGSVPATFLQIRHTDSGKPGLALFTYQGPKSMVASTPMGAMFWSELTQGKPTTCAFYRFIAQSEDTDQEAANKLITFAGQYLDEIHKTSGGKF